MLQSETWTGTERLQQTQQQHLTRLVDSSTLHRITFLMGSIVADVQAFHNMNITSAFKSTNSQRKRLTTRLVLLPYIFLILANFSRHCASLRFSDSVNFWSRRNNGGRNNACFRRRNDRTVKPVASMKSTAQYSSLASPLHSSCQYDQELRPESIFPSDRPVLAIITETDACDTEEKMKHTYETVKKATSTGKVDLVSVRLSLPRHGDERGAENQFYYQILERACRLTKDLVALSDKQKLDQSSKNQDDEKHDNQPSFVVVCSSDLVSVAVKARAHGVHVKEHHLHQLSDIVDQFDYPIVIGTSTHSVESALKSYCDIDDSRLTPHYYFVGTCYLTASHPEKTLESQLEGPELPGRVKQALRNGCASSQLDDSEPNTSIPRIMAIGGIDETNCHEPVALGADGVAVIRAVLQAQHPIERVQDMQAAMLGSYAKQ